VFVVWLIGLALAVAAPVVLVLALRRVVDPATRAGGVLVLGVGLVGAVAGFFFSTLVEFVSERRIDTLNDYWWAAAAAGFTVGALVGVATHASRVARARIERELQALDAPAASSAAERDGIGPAPSHRPADRPTR
jgi:hypothetical protein